MKIVRTVLLGAFVTGAFAACSTNGEQASPPPTGGTESPADANETATSSIQVDAPSCVRWSALASGDTGVNFDDVTSANELVEPLTGMFGHATAIADVNDDGWTDLFVAGFADRPVEEYQVRGADGPSPDRLLLGGPDGFIEDDTFEGELARTSGATFADLDEDGDLDLVVVRNPRQGDDVSARGTETYERTDHGWILASELPIFVAGRSVAAFDVDRDGLTDLAIAGDRFGNGPTRFFRNEGEFEFVDATSEWGVPDDIFGLALATVDLDMDGWLDVVISGDERVLLGGQHGFEIATEPSLSWELHGEEDDPAGIAVGDLDGDGRADLVVGQHFNSTVDEGLEIPIRVFLNQTEGKDVHLVDVTEEMGIPGLWTKSPHVVLADLDNDGHLDIVTSAATANGSPFVLHNTGRDEPGFEPVGDPGDGSYWVTGATDDFDHDGRLDLFMLAWEPTAESKLFANTSESENWIQVEAAGYSSDPTGSSVEAIDAKSGTRLAVGWIDSTTGYASGGRAAIHLGLGSFDQTVEVRLTPVVGEPVSHAVEPNSTVELISC